MKPRMIIVTAETILELFKDYLGEEELPADARVRTKLQIHPARKGKVSFVAESAHFKPSDPPEVEVSFQLKQVFGLGGPTRVQ